MTKKRNRGKTLSFYTTTPTTETLETTPKETSPEENLDSISPEPEGEDAALTNSEPTGSALKEEEQPLFASENDSNLFGEAVEQPKEAEKPTPIQTTTETSVASLEENGEKEKSPQTPVKKWKAVKFKETRKEEEEHPLLASKTDESLTPESSEQPEAKKPKETLSDKNSDSEEEKPLPRKNETDASSSAKETDSLLKKPKKGKTQTSDFNSALDTNSNGSLNPYTAGSYQHGDVPQEEEEEEEEKQLTTETVTPLQNIFSYLRDDAVTNAKNTKFMVFRIGVGLGVAASTTPFYLQGVADYENDIKSYEVANNAKYPHIDNIGYAITSSVGGNSFINFWAGGLAVDVAREISKKKLHNIEKYQYDPSKKALVFAVGFGTASALGTTVVFYFLSPPEEQLYKLIPEAVVTFAANLVLNIAGNYLAKNTLSGIAQKINSAYRYFRPRRNKILNARDDLATSLASRISKLSQFMAKDNSVPDPMKNIINGTSKDILSDLGKAMAVLNLDGRNETIPLPARILQTIASSAAGLTGAGALTVGSLGSIFSTQVGLVELIGRYTSGSWINPVAWGASATLNLSQTALSFLGGFALGSDIFNLVFNFFWDRLLKTEAQQWPLSTRLSLAVTVVGALVAAALAYDSFYTGSLLSLSIKLPPEIQQLIFDTTQYTTRIFNTYYADTAILYGLSWFYRYCTKGDKYNLVVGTDILASFQKALQSEIRKAVLPDALKHQINNGEKKASEKIEEGTSEIKNTGEVPIIKNLFGASNAAKAQQLIPIAVQAIEQKSSKPWCSWWSSDKKEGSIPEQKSVKKNPKNGDANAHTIPTEQLQSSHAKTDAAFDKEIQNNSNAASRRRSCNII